MKSLGVAVGDSGINQEALNALMAEIIRKHTNIDLCLFSDQVIGNAPCAKFCYAELVSFKNPVVVFTIQDVISLLDMHPSSKPIFLFDTQNRGRTMDFMKLLDNIQLTIINRTLGQQLGGLDLSKECYRVTGMMPKDILEVIGETKEIT